MPDESISILIEPKALHSLSVILFVITSMLAVPLVPLLELPQGDWKATLTFPRSISKSIPWL